jgi:cation:H+ antiporter
MIDLFMIIITSGIIFWSGSKFADASSNIGEKLNIPKSVKGATLDAIASSFPELMIALFSVILFKQFEVGIGTIVGSAYFNLLIIPGVSLLLTPKLIKISKDVIYRDFLFYIISVLILIIIVLITKTWGILIAIILIIPYIIYIYILSLDTSKFRKNNLKEKELTTKISLRKEIFNSLIHMFIIGFATYFLTGSAINIANNLGISPIIIGFTIVAIATSLPDAIISFINAKKGQVDDAVSNAIGSNTFNIFIGLGLPLLIATLYFGSVEIIFENIELLFGLLFFSIIVTISMALKRKLTKKSAFLFLFLYIIFALYIIYISLF